MVTIIDPHIKRDSNYRIHQEADSQGLYVKKADKSSVYEGWCWPGSSSWIDFTNPDIRKWWAEQFALDKYQVCTWVETGRAGQYFNIIVKLNIKCHNNRYRREIFSIDISAAQYYRLYCDNFWF